MHFSKDKKTESSCKKYKYKTRKEHVRVTIVDDKSHYGSENGDFLNMGKVPIYDGHTPQTDPFGSYTGVCNDPNEVPVQDVDDL